MIEDNEIVEMLSIVFYTGTFFSSLFALYSNFNYSSTALLSIMFVSVGSLEVEKFFTRPATPLS